MDFGSALNQLRAGKTISRTPWLPRLLVLVPGLTVKVENGPLLGVAPAGSTVNCLPYIAMAIGNGHLVNWCPSQLDVLADDWVSIDNGHAPMPAPEPTPPEQPEMLSPPQLDKLVKERRKRKVVTE